jgi:hypothetical protein
MMRLSVLLRRPIRKQVKSIFLVALMDVGSVWIPVHHMLSIWYMIPTLKSLLKQKRLYNLLMN